MGMGRHHQGRRPRRIKGPGAEYGRALTDDPPARGNAKELINHEWRLPHPLNPGFPLPPMNPMTPGPVPKSIHEKRDFIPLKSLFPIYPFKLKVIGTLELAVTGVPFCLAGTKRQLYTAATAALSRALFPDELSTQALETDPSVETVMPTTVVPDIPALLADSG